MVTDTTIIVRRPCQLEEDPSETLFFGLVVVFAVSLLTLVLCLNWPLPSCHSPLLGRGRSSELRQQGGPLVVSAS